MKKEFKNFRKLIKSIMKKTGLYQEQIAKGMGYSPKTLSRMVTGVDKVTDSAIARLANFLGVHFTAIWHKITEREVILCSKILKKFTDVDYDHDEVQHALHDIGIELQEELIENNKLNRLYKPSDKELMATSK